jgi:hypothetical protein
LTSFDSAEAHFLLHAWSERSGAEQGHRPGSWPVPHLAHVVKFATTVESLPLIFTSFLVARCTDRLSDLSRSRAKALSQVRVFTCFSTEDQRHSWLTPGLSPCVTRWSLPALLTWFQDLSPCMWLCHQTLISSHPLWCESLQVEAGIVLELPDQKARDFLVFIALSR